MEKLDFKDAAKSYALILEEENGEPINGMQRIEDAFVEGAEYAYNLSLQRQRELEKENQRLQNDLLDALDLKAGKGPTALSMLAEAKSKLEKENQELRERLAEMGYVFKRE